MRDPAGTPVPGYIARRCLLGVILDNSRLLAVCLLNPEMRNWLRNIDDGLRVGDGDEVEQRRSRQRRHALADKPVPPGPGPQQF